MKSLHRPDLFSWSTFDAERNVDFHGIAWIRPEGNILIDPLPMSQHDRQHLESMGKTTHIIITNSDHTRVSHQLAVDLGAKIYGPSQEQGVFQADYWLVDGQEIVPGLTAIELNGSKTPGEIALLLHGSRLTLITGDLIRAHRAGSLMMLPDAKLKDKAAALQSIRRLVTFQPDAVLVGDGWQVFAGGTELLVGLG